MRHIGCLLPPGALQHIFCDGIPLSLESNTTRCYDCLGDQESCVCTKLPPSLLQLSQSRPLRPETRTSQKRQRDPGTEQSSHQEFGLETGAKHRKEKEIFLSLQTCA